MLCSHAQLSDKEYAELDQLIGNQIQYEVDPVRSSSIKQLYDGEFFKVKRIQAFNSNGSYSEALFIKANGELTELTDASVLAKYMNKAFVIKTEQDAKLLQSSITQLLDDGNGGTQSLIKKDDTWLLIQSEWFGEKRGYVVTLDTAGKIQTICYSDNLTL
jgi:hypothetical protein